MQRTLPIQWDSEDMWDSISGPPALVVSSPIITSDTEPHQHLSSATNTTAVAKKKVVEAVRPKKKHRLEEEPIRKEVMSDGTPRIELTLGPTSRVPAPTKQLNRSLHQAFSGR